MKKTISIKEFSDELMARIDKSKDIDCCREEIKNLAAICKKEIPDVKIEVTWKELCSCQNCRFTVI